MSSLNFIPEIWAANLLAHLRAVLVFGQPGITNRDYEGEIAQAGDTVHITQFGDPSITDYDATTPLIYDELTDDDRSLVIDKAKSYSFRVDDIDRRQARADFVASVTQAAAYKLMAAADSDISAEMAADAYVGNQVGAVSITSAADAYELLVHMRKLLVERNVPIPGRWCIVPPAFYSQLLLDDRFTNLAAAGSTEALRNGQVGRAAGFDVYESNTCPSGDTLVAGSPIATTFADQILKTEAVRMIDSFGDGVRGLHVYGVKVVQPKALATAVVTMSVS